jgi:hypothetical protein
MSANIVSGPATLSGHSQPRQVGVGIARGLRAMSARHHVNLVGAGPLVMVVTFNLSSARVYP